MALEADLQPSGCWYGHFTSDFCCGTPNSPEVRQKSVVYDKIIYPNVSIKLFMRGVLISTYIHSQNPEGWGIPWLLGLSLQLFHLLQHCGYSVYWQPLVEREPVISQCCNFALSVLQARNCSSLPPHVAKCLAGALNFPVCTSFWLLETWSQFATSSMEFTIKRVSNALAAGRAIPCEWEDLTVCLGPCSRLGRRRSLGQGDDGEPGLWCQHLPARASTDSEKMDGRHANCGHFFPGCRAWLKTLSPTLYHPLAI